MIWAGFLIGFLGSLHCMAMCGPIALSLPIPSGRNRVVGILVYSFGRIVTYGLMGLLFGIFGSVAVLTGFQQLLSLTTGILLLFMAFLSFYGKSIFSFNPVSAKLYWLKNTLGSYLKMKSISSLFFVGLLNGLLPCGLVYVALIGAVAMGDHLLGAGYMMLFGLGTAPLLFVIAYTKGKINFLWRQKAVKLIPFVVGMMGLLLVLRGSNLGIPYLSPSVSSEKLEENSCCHKPVH